MLSEREKMIFLGACILEAGRRAGWTESVGSADESLNDAAYLMGEVEGLDLVSFLPVVPDPDLRKQRGENVP